jgi:hypothetical protein
MGKVAHHGGRRIEVDGDSLGARQVNYDPVTRTWQVTDSLRPGISGGTFRSSTQWSHDRDTALVLGASYDPSGNATIEVQVWDTATQTTRLVTTIPVPLTNTRDSTCIRLDPGYFNYFWVGDPETGHLDSVFVSDPQCRAFYSTATTRGVALSGAFVPRGGQVLVAATRVVYGPVSVNGFSTCPWDQSGRADADQCASIMFEGRPEGATLWAANLPGGPAQTLWNRPGQVFWLGVAEGAGEIVLGEGTVRSPYFLHYTTAGSLTLENQPQILSSCSISYYVQGTGVAAAPAVSNNHVCQVGDVEASIAPTRRGSCLRKAEGRGLGVFWRNRRRRC